MKKFAFTLAETLITAMAIGIILVITIANYTHSDKIKESELLNKTRNFYSSVDNTFQEILLTNSQNATNITKMMDNNGQPITMSSEKLRDFFTEHMSGENIDCTDGVASFASGDEDNFCAKFPGGIYAAFWYNDKCAQTQKNYIKNYYTPDNLTLGNSVNACAYIRYSLKDTTKTLGKDMFRIALGKQKILNDK